MTIFDDNYDDDYDDDIDDDGVPHICQQLVAIQRMTNVKSWCHSSATLNNKYPVALQLQSPLLIITP